MIIIHLKKNKKKPLRCQTLYKHNIQRNQKFRSEHLHSVTKRYYIRFKEVQLHSLMIHAIIRYYTITYIDTLSVSVCGRQLTSKLNI